MVTSAINDFPTEIAESFDFSRNSEVVAAGGCATCCDGDAIICRCFQVTKAEVHEAVASGNARTISQLRCQTNAGTGCMACLCKIKQMLAERAEALAVEAGELELAVV
jgi:NAD(P)H-nitrite reductase large subunit